MDFGLTFDDVCLVPRYNNVPSRTEPSTSTWLTKNIEIGMPLIPANMDTVIGSDLAHIIVKNGGVPIFHRFTTFQAQRDWVEEFEGRVILSCGIGKFNEISDIINLGPVGLCIDVAHGHSERMVDLIKRIKDFNPSMEIIAGNVCTPRAYHDLVNAGASAVKIGIGPGAACTTRIVTGFGVPQFTAIRNCAEEAAHLRVPIIADGGIRNSSDVVKALAAGASTVMMGKAFALTHESAAEKQALLSTYPGGPTHRAKYRGQASADFQIEFYGGLKSKTVAEGTDFWADVTGTSQELIDEMMGGLRSGLTYAGARDIKELHRKAEFMKVSASYGLESNPRRG